MISGRLLVRGGGDRRTSASFVLCTNVPLSFWGGVDPETGVVIDTRHPLFDKSISDCILCLPSGRGSCTASQVLLELILNGQAPRALVLRDIDGLVCVGAIVAQEVFAEQVPDIICLGSEKFNSLLEKKPEYGVVQKDGSLVLGDTKEEVEGLTDKIYPVSNRDVQSNASMTCEEEQMLQSVSNEAERMAMQVLIRYAKLSSSKPKYLEISKAHIDGCTYIGPGGLKFVRELVEASGRVKVPTTLNSVSADRRQWQALGVPSDYARASIDLGDAYLDLGCQDSFTCAPYLLPDPPHFGENIIWGESNAVVYSNSVLGARTEKYADYLDICCAIVGKVPATGVHLEENRRPRIILDATDLLNELWTQHVSPRNPGKPDIESFFPTLGHLCGTLSDGRVPLLLGFQGGNWASFITSDHMKSFCAAYGTTGTSPLIHVAGITPEAQDPALVKDLVQSCDGFTRNITMTDLVQTFRELNGAGGLKSEKERIDLIALGNPHLSLSECENMWKMVTKSDAKHPDVRMMACISRPIQKQAQELGYISKLEEFGVEFVNDTCWCMMLDPPVIPRSTNAVILTNSGKYAHYGPGLTRRTFRLGSLEDCFRTAVTGKYRASGFLSSWSSAATTKVGQQRTYSATRTSLLQPFCREYKRWKVPRIAAVRFRGIIL